MKKSRILAAAMASIAISGALASCGREDDFEAENNVNVCVYGPPEYFDGSSEEDEAVAGQEFFETSSADTEQAASDQGD